MKKNVLLTTVSPEDVDIQLALYYLKAYFIKHSPLTKSASIDILSFSYNEKIEIMISRIKERKPRIIGFSCYVWNITKILKIAGAVKKGAPYMKIVLGGPEVSPRAYSLVKRYKFIDAVVIGEGERTFNDLLGHWLTNRADISDINGIAYRQKGKVLLTPKREQISDLDEIPSPYLEKVVDEKLIKGYHPYIPMETMRGCAYRCHYCYYHKNFEKLSYFSLERVERELKYLLKRKSKGIYLMDPTFNTNKKRAKEILRIFIKYNKKTSLHIELRAELLDKEMVELLHAAAADFIEIGIQSINKKTLRLINRSFEPDRFRRNILLLNKKRLPYEIQLIDGLPADNYESLKKAVDWLFALKPSAIKIMRFMLLPGTYLRQNASHFGIRYDRKPPYHSIESDTFSAGDLRKTQRLRDAIGALYISGLLQKSIYPLAEKLGIDFSEIFEEWNRWTEGRPRNRARLLRELDSEKDPVIKRLMALLPLNRLTDIAVDFVKDLCQKHDKARVAGELANLVDQDTKAFLRRYGIIKERLRCITDGNVKIPPARDNPL